MRTRRLASSSDPVPPAAFANPRSAEGFGEARATASRRKHRPKATQAPGHQTVLLHEAIQELEISPDDIVVDATLGAAGHAKRIAEKLGPKGTLIGIDADSAAVERAKKALEHFNTTRIRLIEGNFRNLEALLHTEGINTIDKAIFDLGWSGYQLAAGRGFSFQSDEPLLMTYSESVAPFTARDVVNSWSEEDIANVLYGWGEERYARRIARKILEARKTRSIETSAQLAALVKDAVPRFYRIGKLHPATKTFQALRIAVNDEIGALREGISAAWKMLSPRGRIAVITFHSIEDREVKRLFREWAAEGSGTRITKKPIVPANEELRLNPRARSAKLRVIERSRK